MGEWRYASYKQKGLSHLKDGTNCQDNTCVVETKDYIVAALADGLGSLKYSEIASDVATKSICKAFENLNCSKKELSNYLLQCVVENIQQEADARGIAIKEMDCTLVFVYINKKESKAIIGRLGDSAICVFGENNSIALNDGNKSANGTSAVLDRDAIENFTINLIDCKKEKIKGFILSSDGLENILYMKGSNSVNKAAEEYFNTLVTSTFPNLELRQKIFKLVNVSGSPFDDDISIIVIGCNDEAISLPEDATWLCKCGCRNPLYATYCINCNSDFTILYENVKFKEYGGKAAFFKKINQNPEKEKRLLGIGNVTGLVRPKRTDMVSKLTESVDDFMINIVPTQRETDGFETTRSVADQRRAEKKKSVPSMQESQMPINHSTYKEKKVDNIGVKKNKHPLMSESELNRNQNVENGNDMGTPIYKPVHNNNELTSHQDDEPKETKNKKKKSKKSNNYALLILLISSILFSLFWGILLTSLIMSKSIRNKSDEIDELKSEIVRLENEKEQNEKNTEVDLPILEENSCIHLDSYNYYWGKLDDQNEPNGIGIMKDGDIYYVGVFEHGKKNGQFTIMDSKGIETVVYKNDKIVESEPLEKTTQSEHSDDLQEKSYKLLFKANLREKAGSNNALVKELSTETFVIPSEGTEATVDGEIWINVKTSDGYYEGWILKNLIDYGNLKIPNMGLSH